MNNPGKYDDLCTMVREAAEAEGAILIIVNGNKGAGFSVQGTAKIIPGIPDMLEYTANAIRLEQRGKKIP